MMEKYRDLAKRIIKEAKADHVVVNIWRSKEDNTRFGETRITQNMSKDETLVKVEVSVGKKTGSVSFTLHDDVDIGEIGRRARDAALGNVEDPEFLPPVEKVEIPFVSRKFESTENLDPVRKAEILRDIFNDARSSGLSVAGLFTNGLYQRAFLNSNGLEAYYEATGASFSITVQTQTSSGYAKDAHENFERLNPFEIYEVAKRKAIVGQNPRDLEPGYYDVVLEPLAVADFLDFMIFDLDARGADEGRNYFAGKMGQKIFDERVTLYTDPLSELNPWIPFDDDGVPIEKTIFIRNGVLENLYYDRFWAFKNNRKPTGRFTSYILEGGSLSVDELVKKVERGLLVTRFWYIRYVDRKSLTVTGMTRDGLFYIENGEIKYPVKNFRFNESPARVLNAIIEVGKGRRVVGEEFSFPAYVPALLVKDFNFASKTEF